MPRPRQGFQHFIIKLVVALEILMTSLAEIYDTGLALAICIVKNILESQCVCCVSVFIIISRINQLHIVAGSIGYHYDFGIKGHATIRRNYAVAFCPTSSCDTCRMRAMCLGKTVEWMTDGK